MARHTRFLTDEQWSKIKPLLPNLKPGPNGGRPWADSRQVLEGILWILRTGAPIDCPGQFDHGMSRINDFLTGFPSILVVDKHKVNDLSDICNKSWQNAIDGYFNEIKLAFKNIH